MTATALPIDVIVSNPEIRNGHPIINGTTIRVSDLVVYHISGNQLTPEQLSESFNLSLGQVYAALAYYHLHRAEIETEIQENKAKADQWIADLEKQGRVTRLD